MKIKTERLGKLVGIVKLAHDGQFLDDGKTPYITHLVAVKEMVNEWGGSERACAAAVSHEILNKCSSDVAEQWNVEMRKLYPGTEGDAIYRMVSALTEDDFGGVSPKLKAEFAVEQIIVCSYRYPEVVMIAIADRLNMLVSFRLLNKRVMFNETYTMFKQLIPIAHQRGLERAVRSAMGFIETFQMYLNKLEKRNCEDMGKNKDKQSCDVISEAPDSKFKRITVRVRLEKTSQELIYENVWNTYQKGDLYCICNHDTVVKIPIDHIFDIRETY